MKLNWNFQEDGVGGSFRGGGMGVSCNYKLLQQGANVWRVAIFV